jgi:predicted nucleic acid-binding Zn ribbon protein
VTSPTIEPNERMREERRKRIKIRQRRRKRFMNWLIYPFCILFIAVIIVANVSIQSDRPRSDAAVIQVLESRGGEVVRIAHYGGFSRFGGGGGGDGGYVDVMFGGKAGVRFDGQLNRCDLDALDERPPVFTPMVTSQQPHWEMGDEPVLGCDPGAEG